MGQIYIKFDNQLKQSEIQMPLTDSTNEQAGEDYSLNRSGVKQTDVYGVLVPIIQINNTVVRFDDIAYFELDATKLLPNVSLGVIDRYKLTTMLDTPNSDNQLRIQILPPYDNAYKKIDLTFYITSFDSIGDQVEIVGKYYCPKLTQAQYKSFGEIDTYTLFEEVAKDTQLGFASNCDGALADKRMIYCAYQSYSDLLSSEIPRAANDRTHIYSWWVDLWNNINFVNVYERYNTIDPDEDLMIWTTSGVPNILPEEQQEPCYELARITNNPQLGPTALNTQEMQKINSLGSQIGMGTDTVFSIYDYDNDECQSYLIQDGDVKTCATIQCEYAGEVYGGYNYRLAEACYTKYSQKMSLETIKITLNTPILGLMRGGKVIVSWYYNNQSMSDRLEGLRELGALKSTEDVETNVNGVDEEFAPDSGFGHFEPDLSVTGQYFIDGCEINYRDSKWEYILTLKKPKSVSLLNDALKENDNNLNTVPEVVTTIQNTMMPEQNSEQNSEQIS